MNPMRTGCGLCADFYPKWVWGAVVKSESREPRTPAFEDKIRVSEMHNAICEYIEIRLGWGGARDFFLRLRKNAYDDYKTCCAN